MKLIKDYGRIAFLSTYPPQECGLATFTRDLVTALGNIGINDTEVVAVNDRSISSYDSKVSAVIRKNERKDYDKAAHGLKAADVDLLMVEHEYGIFGGERGEYVLDMVENLEMPVITTLHTILPEPDAKQRSIINTLGKRSEKIITMAGNTKQMLQSIYGIDPWKIEMIHHGVPKKIFVPRETLKMQYGYQDKRIISTFGLIGPGKGLEYGIEAISKIDGDKSDILYLILGQTHPALGKEGTSYRNKLENLVKELGLDNNVRFINRYLSVDEIIQYLQLSDIYMTPYTGKDQAVSGTMAYAVGYGKAIVSTPYLYAREMLSDGRGMLAEFNDPGSLADCINDLLQNPYKRLKMERDIEKTGRTMFWDKVAQRYAEVILKTIKSISAVGVV
jgi:glycosyltransferase involved in cell wall biosynthesis